MISVNVRVATSHLAFSKLALTQSAPGAFPDFTVLISFLTYSANGGSVLTCRLSLHSEMSALFLGAFLLSMVSKYLSIDVFVSLQR